jgi:hypothetical protein
MCPPDFGFEGLRLINMVEYSCGFVGRPDSSCLYVRGLGTVNALCSPVSRYYFRGCRGTWTKPLTRRPT